MAGNKSPKTIATINFKGGVGNDDAVRILEGKSAADLQVMAKELGISFSKSRPSIRKMREAIVGKVRESVLLSRHHRRS
jgi:hypothetical protein